MTDIETKIWAAAFSLELSKHLSEPYNQYYWDLAAKTADYTVACFRDVDTKKFPILAEHTIGENNRED